MTKLHGHAPAAAMSVRAATPEKQIVANDLRLGDLGRALAQGWHDFLAAPRFGLFFAGVYVVAGLVLLWGVSRVGEGWWTVPLIAGFPLFAPFAAVGLYEVSRRREAGEPLSWRAVLGAFHARGDDQLLMIGGLVFVAFALWIGMAHGIFAIFLGESGIGSTSPAQLLSPQGLAMLGVGGAIGGVFALALFAATVLSIPMLVDREVDFISAIILSFTAIARNTAVMLVWAAIIAGLLALALIPAFLGLLIALPVLGHATWHLYRRVTRG